MRTSCTNLLTKNYTASYCHDPVRVGPPPFSHMSPVAVCADCGLIVKEASVSSADSSYASILEECATIAREREPKYGEAVQNMRNIAATAKQMFNLDLTDEQITEVFIATKVERDKTCKQDDNIVDNINYDAIRLACRRAKRQA